MACKKDKIILFILQSNSSYRMSKNMLEKDPSSDTTLMLEEAINKSYAIIKTILPKLNSLYQLNEELERSVSNLERKLTQLELDNEDIHGKIRANNLNLQTKVNSLAMRIEALANETFPRPRLHQGHGRSKGRLQSEKKIEQSHFRQEKSYRQKDRTRKIVFQDEKVKQQSKKKSLKRKNSIELGQNNTEAKVHFDVRSVSYRAVSQKNISFNSHKTILQQESNINRKTGMKPKRQEKIKSSICIKKRKEGEPQRDATFQREIGTYHSNNQKMKNYEKKVDQYYQKSAQQFAATKAQIEQINSKITQLTSNQNMFQLTQKSQSTQQALQTYSSKTIQQLKNMISQKVDACIFEKAFKDFTHRLTQTHEFIRKLANRDETRRAIEFLEGKLNFLAEKPEAGKQMRQTMHLVEIDAKELSHSHNKHTLRGQPFENTLRTLRNDQKMRLMKKDLSLMNSTHSDGIDHQARLSLAIKNKKQQQATVRVTRCSMMPQKQLTLLKQKSMAALAVEKGKVKPRLKKERGIFQYD